MTTDTESSRDPERSRRRLWVVLFDLIHLPEYFSDCVAGESTEPNADSVAELVHDSSESTDRVFDDLDVRSVFFEQFLIQDVRAEASDSDKLGGPHLVHDALTQLHQADRKVCCVSVLNQGNSLDSNTVANSKDQSQSLLAIATSLNATPISFAFSGMNTQSVEAVPQNLESTLRECDLALFRVLNSAECCDSADHIDFESERSRCENFLRWILTLQAAQGNSESVSAPWLIIAGLSGVPRKISEPFSTGLDEGLVRVPLWIDAENGHAKRVQSIVGSFDLLPTVLSLLLDHAQPFANSGLHSSSAECARSLSLTPFCLKNNEPSEASQVQFRNFAEQRILPLTGDGWTALRAQPYLLVQSAADPEFDNGMERKLYLKPDDLWNLNDVFVSYEAIADAMQERIAAD